MANIQTRQNLVVDGNDDPYYRYGGFWYSQTGVIVKWSLFFGLLALFAAFLIGGRWHAMKRIKKGLPPKGYHGWMLNRRTRAIHDPRYRDPQVYYNTYPTQNSQYGMHPMPPPMYDPNSAPPPTYQPPGNSKIDPSQAGAGNSSYQAPAGPPPAHINNTGSSHPFRG